MDKGKVWLVGAGPGDPGLFTVKGKKVLDQADAVVYDALVSDAVLAGIPEKAELVYVGKRAGHHAMSQEQINDTLAALAKQGKKVVRLKGGDPFLFGRGAEEMEALLKAQIPWEVVPGISSSLAVPAYNGIPVTHRAYASAVHIITGHRKKDQPLSVDFDALCRAGGTFVFLMGTSSLPEICQGFLQAGMEANTPAALLSRGTTAGQKKILATVATLAERAAEEKPEMPAILVIGEVCALSEAFSWYEKLPLYGKKVILTRPRERSRQLAERLGELGAEVLEIPVIKTVPIEHAHTLDAALKKISEYQWLVFTSPAGVDLFFEKLRLRKQDIRSLAGIRLAAIGEGTAQRLKERGLLVDLVPKTYSGEALGQALAEAVQPGDRILIPRAKEGNQQLIQEIKRAGNVTVEDAPLYETVYEDRSCVDLVQTIGDAGDACIVVFTSSSTVKGFVELTAGLKHEQIQAACIGERTCREAKRFQMQAKKAEKATVDSLVELVVSMAQSAD